MSTYLGFTPTEKPNYYFVSYNSDDSQRVGRIAQFLSYGNLPIWYDFGLEYGEKWERSITKKLKDAQAVLLFFTKGILQKENSYVRKEYLMATQFFDKKVYVIMMDDIQNKDVPYDKVPWWIDIQDKQSLPIMGIDDPGKASSVILSVLGMNSHADKMNQLIQNYKELYDAGQAEEAEAFLNEYLHGVGLRNKAGFLANLLVSGKDPSAGEEVPRVYQELKNHLGQVCDSFVECRRIRIQGIPFTVGNCFVFHRGNRGDAHVIHIWREDTLLYTVSGLIEAQSVTLHYDGIDDILYLGYVSAEESMEGPEVVETFHQSILTVEKPCGEPVCNDFRFLHPVD